MDQKDLFAELASLRRSLARLLPELPSRTEDWRPRQDMRSGWELAAHLVEVPAVDTLISTGARQDAVRALETSLATDTPAGLLAVFDRGVAEAERRFGAMGEREFDESVGTAFYGHAMPAKGWLLEIVTHCHHHRAMLYTYLKLLGRAVDMSFLYA